MSEGEITFNISTRSVRGRHKVTGYAGEMVIFANKVDPHIPAERDAILADVKSTVASLGVELNGHEEILRQKLLQLAEAKSAPPKTKEPNDVLIPGAHLTAAGEYIEQGNDTFAEQVCGKLPSTIYRRSNIAGILAGEVGEKAFVPMTSDDARIAIDGAVRLSAWRKNRNDESIQVFRPTTRDLAGVVLSRASRDPRIPVLKSLTSYPIFVPGFNLSRPGLHDGVFYDEPECLRGIVPELDPRIIRETLDDLTVDFPFKERASRENFYGLLITPIIRPALEGNTPGHVGMASLERTGKTKLIEQVWGVIITGKKLPATQLPKHDEEFDKRITAMLLRGDTLMHLDNLAEQINMPSLASLLTAGSYQGRRLGSSTILQNDNNLTIAMSGNNPKMSGELVKRMVPIILHPATDAPELRTDFKHPDLFSFVRKQRRVVMACLLGMVELWIRAGKPRGQHPMGGFDEWAAAVGGIMDVVGFDQWMSNTATWRSQADTRRDDLRALVTEWLAVQEACQKDGVSILMGVNDVLEIATRLDLFPTIICGKEGKALHTAFGMQILARNIDSPIRTNTTQKESVANEGADPFSVNTFANTSLVTIRRSNLSRPAHYSLEVQPS